MHTQARRFLIKWSIDKPLPAQSSTSCGWQWQFLAQL